ncbi:MAG: low molecular weight phosphatase family protein [Armatimonadota bacterium]
MKTALFVCVHNAGRSQAAEALLNHIASERSLPIRWESAGTKGGAMLNPTVVALMQLRGISMDGQSPKVLTQDMVDSADKVITLGCGVDADKCPARVHFTDDWGLDDPKGRPEAEVEVILTEIEARVIQLIDELDAF